MLEEIVKNDSKSRFRLTSETDAASGLEVWWIRANQGHSMKVCLNNAAVHPDVQGLTQSVVLDLEPISLVADIPTGIAVHGTTRKAWELIRMFTIHAVTVLLTQIAGEQGLSKMSRNHIHLAQGVPGSGAISGVLLHYYASLNCLTFR